MSKKQSRRDFWRWWREQEEIEKSIKVWPYAGEWFWQAPYRMSGRANTRHEAMGAAKAALRELEESAGRATMVKEWRLMPDGQWWPYVVVRAPGLSAITVPPDQLGGILQGLRSQGVHPRWVAGEGLEAIQARLKQAMEYSSKGIGRCALAMGRAAGAAARMGATMEAVSDE